jgi:hypothetical protein
VIRAEHRHGATVRWPLAATPYERSPSRRTARVLHSHLVIRGLVFDGSRGAWGGVQVDAGRPLVDLLIEDNVITNQGSNGIGLFDVQGVIIRHNRIEGTGFRDVGESFYLASSTNGTKPVLHVEIYGNMVRSTTNQFIDHKSATHDVQTHHNVFEQLKLRRDQCQCDPNNHDGSYYKTLGADDGLYYFHGTTHRFHDNIVRDSESSRIMRIAPAGSHAVAHNVFTHLSVGEGMESHGSWAGVPGGGSPSEISYNTFCQMTATTWVIGSGLNVHDNPGWGGTGAPQSACDTEVTRILAEMRVLPGYPGSAVPGDLTGDGQVTLADLRLLAQMLVGQATPSAEARTLAAPVDRLTVADAQELARLLGNE